MKIIFHQADSRGLANHGWLKSNHTFSFARYYNPERMNFGALRVLNDDYVEAGKGFGRHPHDNMEIISIPLKGDLRHEDSMGNTTVIRQGDVQAMSAGTGVTHSEMNDSAENPVEFLQIWVFPKTRNIEPNYSQITLDEAKLKNTLQPVVTPDGKDGTVEVNQDTWFNLGYLDAGKRETYRIQKPGNGVYVFVLEGEVKVGDQALNKRDGFGVWETDAIDIEATTDARVLLMEVPMTVPGQN